MTYYFNCLTATSCTSTASVTLSLDIQSSRFTDVYIGQHRWDPAWYGWFSEVRLYKRALTLAEVYAIKAYDGTNPTAVNSVDYGLLAYYQFESDGFLLDATGVTGSLIPTGLQVSVVASLPRLQNAASLAQTGGLVNTNANRQHFRMPQIRIGLSFSICVWYNPDINSGNSPSIVELTSGSGVNAGQISIRRYFSTSNLTFDIFNGGDFAFRIILVLCPQ